jgi:hypothetical protein
LTRDEVIKKLKDLGITEVNGIPLEEFIKLSGPGMKKITPGKYISNPEPFSVKEI